MSDSLPVIAFFRSCLRPSFRAEVIKSFRGLPGEHTHTTYRSIWLTDEVVDYFKRSEDFIALSILVDPLSELAFPSRVMTPVEAPRFNSGYWNFTFELGNFVSVSRRVERRLREWPSSENLTPPTKFVSMLDETWFKYQETEYKKSKSDWKQSIDFVLEHWSVEFQDSVFLRPSRVTDFKVCDSGPSIAIRQSDEVRLSLDSYNPHLSDGQLSTKRLNVGLSDVLGDVASIPRISSDGEIAIALTFLEPGSGRILVDVQPDAHLSVYIPITTVVGQNPNVDPIGPRVLGAEWRRFLNGVRQETPAERSAAMDLFTRLADVFPGDSELLIQRGLLHLGSEAFTAARDDFKQPLTRNDPRAVWGSLIAGLHLGEESSALDLLNASTALPSSEENQALFEAAIAQLSSLPDSTIEWFCEYPRATISDEKSLRMLIEMTRGPRRERALLRVFAEMGRLNPEIAIREADPILQNNSQWRQLRYLRAQLARRVNHQAFGEIDAEILFEYQYQSLSEYSEMIEQLKPMVHPQRLPTILFANALKIFSSDQPERVGTAIVLALNAAHLAAENGDIEEAQRCLGFLELRLMENELENRSYRAAVNQVAARVTSLLNAREAIASVVDEDLKESAASLRAEYQDRKIVIFGGHTSAPKESRLKEILGVSHLVWIDWQDSIAPDAKSLLEHADSGSTLVIISLDDGLIPTSIRHQMRLREVVMARSLDSLGGIFRALKSLIEHRHDPKSYVPATCEEALQWARLNCPNLEFSAEVDARVAELDAIRQPERLRIRIVEDLKLLNQFAVDSKSGVVGGGMKVWLQLRGFNPNDYASGESDTTTNNAQLRRERTFQCSEGNIFMPSHFKLPGEYPNRATIHFNIDFASKLGKVLIGYVGPHLSLKK